MTAIGSDRRDWPASLLRRLWEALVEAEPGRPRTARHEARWLNLAGFSLRPGYGLAMEVGLEVPLSRLSEPRAGSDQCG